MTRELRCLNCYHAAIHKPPDWVPEYEGQLFSEYLAIRHIRKTRLALPLTCTLSPEWHEFNTNHYCGQWAPRSKSLVQALETANEYMRNFRERAEEAEETNARLKLELKKTRDRSRSRLDKLRTIKQPGKAAE